MARPLSILIVEDETPLAELHAESLRRFPGCGQVWLAGNLAQARRMIAVFQPALILLDNYLPDGKGLALLHELNAARFTGDVIFITAASDMETVAEAVRSGVFDYLVKPVAWSRLEQSLIRYRLRMRMRMLAGNTSASQSQIDEMFNAYARGEPGEMLPLNIDLLTLEKIERLFRVPGARHTAQTVAQALQISRTTARRYLEFCASRRRIKAEVEYGKVGRPQRIYQALATQNGGSDL